MSRLFATMLALAAFVFAGGYMNQAQAASITAQPAMSNALQGDATVVQYGYGRRRCRQVPVKRCKKRWIGQKCRTIYEEVCSRGGRDYDDDRGSRRRSSDDRGERDRDGRGRSRDDDDDRGGRRRAY